VGVGEGACGVGVAPAGVGVGLAAGSVVVASNDSTAAWTTRGVGRDWIGLTTPRT